MLHKFYRQGMSFSWNEFKLIFGNPHVGNCISNDWTSLEQHYRTTSGYTGNWYHHLYFKLNTLHIFMFEFYVKFVYELCRGLLDWIFMTFVFWNNLASLCVRGKLAESRLKFSHYLLHYQFTIILIVPRICQKQNHSW